MNDTVATLCEIPSGSAYMIDYVDDTLPIKGRLRELGFFRGAIVDKLQTGACGSPIAFRICGAVIAIRYEDADRIFVKL